jgi:uncharacterized protein (TIGR02001 family)
MIKQTALALVAATAAGVSAQAQDAASELSVTVDVTYVTDYIFRGTQLADASIQPSVEAAYGDFYAGVWHSDALSQSVGFFDSETDLYVGYGYAVTETIGLDAGVTRYTYNGGGSGDTTEVFVGASVDVLLTPSVYFYHDFDLEVSTYEASIGHSIPVDAINASLDLSAKLGVVTAPGEDYTYGVVGAAIPFTLNETATLTIGVDYVLNDTDAIRPDFNTLEFTENDIVVGKVGLSIGF